MTTFIMDPMVLVVVFNNGGFGAGIIHLLSQRMINQQYSMHQVINNIIFQLASGVESCP